MFMKNIYLILIALISLVTLAFAEPGVRQRPFGAYCPDGRRGAYGERLEVKDLKSAKEIIKKFYEKNDDITIGDIIERRGFFEVTIYDKKGNLIDILIIHKRSGRIRSIY